MCRVSISRHEIIPDRAVLGTESVAQVPLENQRVRVGEEEYAGVAAVSF